LVLNDVMPIETKVGVEMGLGLKKQPEQAM